MTNAPGSKARDRILLGLLMIAALIVFAVDLFLVSEPVLPAAMYAVPVIAAAWFLPPWKVAAVAVWAGGLELASALMHSPPLWLIAAYMVGIALFGLLSTVVSVKIRRESALATRAETSAKDAWRRAAELRNVLDNMVDAVFVADVEGRITLANTAGLRLLGTEAIEKPDVRLADLLGLLRVRQPDGSPVSIGQLPLTRALSGETVLLEDALVNTPWTRRDIYTRTSATPVRDPAGSVVGAVQVTRDITEMAELDRMKDQFIAITAHELKTPVTIMKGYAQLLLRQSSDLCEQKLKMLTAVNDGADRITNVVNNILDISALQAGELILTTERLDLRDLAERVITRVASASPGHRLRLAAPVSVPVQGDRHRLEQLLVNLIDNAVKYSPAGGDVEVEVSRGEEDAMVSVRDKGIGIPAGKQRHIFQRFYRAHSGTPHDYGGMGTGLYLARELVLRHGGNIWFDSEEGLGSAFHFTLPLAGE